MLVTKESRNMYMWNQNNSNVGRKSVGARTLTVLKFGNSGVFVEDVSGAMAQNSIRGVKVESKPSFCN